MTSKYIIAETKAAAAEAKRAEAARAAVAKCRANETKPCLRCGKLFKRGHLHQSTWRRRKYCGPKCQAQAAIEVRWEKTKAKYAALPDSKICPVCGKTFYRDGRQSAAWLAMTNCSRKCGDAARSKNNQGRSGPKVHAKNHCVYYYHIAIGSEKCRTTSKLACDGCRQLEGKAR